MMPTSTFVHQPLRPSLTASFTPWSLFASIIATSWSLVSPSNFPICSNQSRTLLSPVSPEPPPHHTSSSPTPRATQTPSCHLKALHQLAPSYTELLYINVPSRFLCPSSSVHLTGPSPHPPPSAALHPSSHSGLHPLMELAILSVVLRPMERFMVYCFYSRFYWCTFVLLSFCLCISCHPYLF